MISCELVQGFELLELYHTEAQAQQHVPFRSTFSSRGQVVAWRTNFTHVDNLIDFSVGVFGIARLVLSVCRSQGECLPTRNQEWMRAKKLHLRWFPRLSTS